MAKKRGNIYQQDGKIGFVIRWRDSQGRRKGRLVKVTSAKEAVEALAAEKAKVEKERILGMPMPTGDTFETFSKEFLAHQEKRISPRVVKGKISRAEYERQKGIVETKLNPFFGSMKLAAIRKSDVKRYIDKRTGDVADGTIIKEVNTLKRLFNVALALEQIPANPAQRAALPQAPEGRNRWLTPEEWHKVFEACRIEPGDDDPKPQQWLQWAAGLAVALGTRRGELMHTTVPDIDLDTRHVMLRATKNGKPRPVFINDLAMQVFVAMGMPARKQSKDRGVLFPSITPAQLSMRFIRACRTAGVEDFSLHDLRHTYASHLRMKGADLDDIRRLLGHGDLRMTIRYAHLGQSHLDAAASRLDGVLTLPAIPEQEDGVQASNVQASN
jgi:integrase